MNAVIQSAATDLAEAEVAAEATAANLATASAALQEIVDRLAAIEAERASIVAARKRGEDDKRHGERLALLAADAETLREIDAERAAALATAQATADTSNQSVAVTRAALDRARQRSARPAHCPCYGSRGRADGDGA
jgi:hypothetical protein